MIVMVEIFNYSSSVYEKHASNSKVVSDFKKEVQMDGVALRDVARHAQILDMKPKPSALSSLMQTDQRSHWASFSPPVNFYTQRFATPYLAPSLGAPDQQDEDIEKVAAYLKVLTRGKFVYRDTSEDKEEGEGQEWGSEEEENVVKEGLVLLKALDQGVKASNVMVDYIISRIFQFVQG